MVELIGGSDGPALTLARAALTAGKSVVTANKAMIAHHGLELAEAAERANVALKFEAAVAGGVPVIKGLREGAAANELSQVYGILNGTCNYILSKMEAEGRDFAEVLAEAQALGFAEADPSFDIDGVDAAHKLSILASIAFGTRPAFGEVAITGLELRIKPEGDKGAQGDGAGAAGVRKTSNADHALVVSPSVARTRQKCCVDAGRSLPGVNPVMSPPSSTTPEAAMAPNATSAATWNSYRTHPIVSFRGAAPTINSGRRDDVVAIGEAHVTITDPGEYERQRDAAVRRLHR